MNDLRIIGIGPITRLRLARIRFSARLFCWCACHLSRVAETWAFGWRRERR